MRVLALDLATRSGWAVVLKGVGTVASGSWDLSAGIPTGVRTKPSNEARHALLVQALRRQISRVIEAHRPDAVAIERDFGRGAGGRLLACLQCAGHEAALDAGLPALSIDLSTWRTSIHGRPAKGESRRTTEWFKGEAIRLCPDAVDPDEAEAILIARYAAANIRVHPVSPTAQPLARAA